MKDMELVSKIKVYDINEYDALSRDLISCAQNAAKRSYSPYSEFRVGSAVLLENGEIITGNNQENAAYPSGLCAERTAVFYANSTFPEIPVVAIAVAAWHKGDFTDTVCSPCGACRQVIAEVEKRFGTPVKIIMCAKNKVYEVDTIKTLLPLSFDSDMLG